MKTLLALFITSFCIGQNVDILDKNRKVIKSVDEKELQQSAQEIGKDAHYVARWVYSEGKAKECAIKWKNPAWTSI